MNNVYLVQPNFNYGPGSRQEYYIPYSVGLLWSYASQFPLVNENFDLKEIIFRRESISNVLNRMDDPSVAAFSCYIWNWEYNKALAEQVKKKFPSCKIIFGGPQVTDKPFQKLFFHNHKYVDIVVNGEGEYAFNEILQSIAQDLPVKKIYSQTRITELDSIPSPYLTGVFDTIIKDNPEFGWQMTLETNRGCPFACTFCDWGGLTYSKVKKFDITRVADEVQWASDNRIEYLYIADANYGIFYERDKEIALHISRIIKETGYPRKIAATWNKNSQNKTIEIAKILGSRGLTLSVQSMDDEVLTTIKRKNMEVSNMAEMLKVCEQQGVTTYTEMILGLPKESFESWRAGHYKLLEHGQHGMIDVYLTMLLENSELNSQVEQYSMKTIDVYNYILGSDGDNAVKEKVSIVTETDTMTFDELIDSYMFSWMMLVFHYLGYTQVYSRYFNNKNLVSYQTFYNTLFKYIKQSTGTINVEYLRVKNLITEYLTTGDFTPTSNFDSGTVIIWKTMHTLPVTVDALRNELEDFVKSNFVELVDTELLEFQRHYTVDVSRQYPYKLEIPAEIYNTVFETSIYNKSAVTLELNSLVEQSESDAFYKAMYTGRKQGISKAVIRMV